MVLAKEKSEKKRGKVQSHLWAFPGCSILRCCSHITQPDVNLCGQGFSHLIKKIGQFSYYYCRTLQRYLLNLRWTWTTSVTKPSSLIFPPRSNPEPLSLPPNWMHYNQNKGGLNLEPALTWQKTTRGDRRISFYNIQLYYVRARHSHPTLMGNICLFT